MTFPFPRPFVHSHIPRTDAQEDPQTLQTLYPPTPSQTPLGDVFTSCNWVIRDGAPKTASKRVFLMTDEDDPHKSLLGRGNEKLLGPARTTLVDLAQAGVSMEPFFISTPENKFDPTKFYSVCPPPHLPTLTNPYTSLSSFNPLTQTTKTKPLPVSNPP